MQKKLSKVICDVYARIYVYIFLVCTNINKINNIQEIRE